MILNHWQWFRERGWYELEEAGAQLKSVAEFSAEELASMYKELFLNVGTLPRPVS